MTLEKFAIWGAAVGFALAAGCAGAQPAVRSASMPQCAVGEVVAPVPDNQRGTQPMLAGAGKVVSAKGDAARGNAKIAADAPQAITPVDPQVARGNANDSCAGDRMYARR